METYIVRIREPDPAAVPVAEPGPRGVIRHVRTGRETPFVSWEELQRILAGSMIASSGRPMPARGARDPR